MNIEIVAFGIAKDIIDGKMLNISISDSASIGDLKKHLLEQFPAFKDLVSLSFAVDEEYQKDEYLLKENQTVVIVPPVSGG